ncbi:MAG TPA: AAA family ATPase [Nocardioides sp.]|nr:AAA family ATPase [Nocardioides sp.]
MADLLGRTAELDEVADVLGSVDDGAVAIQVRADAGMGKTALLDEVARLAGARGFLVLRGAGVDLPGVRSYAALADLLGQALDEVGPELPDPLRDALEVAVLRRRAPETDTDPHAVARAFLTALGLLARSRPVLVLVDDVHWLDTETARALAFVLPRLGETRVAVVLAARDQPSLAPVDLAGALRSMPDERGSTTVRLSALGLDQVALLTAREGSRPLSRGELQRVHEASGGNPLFVLELARSLRQSAPGVPMSVPTSLSDLIGRRVRALPAEATAVLATMALTTRTDRALLGAVTARSDEEVDAAVDLGIDAGLVTERDGALAFTHPLLRLAVTGAAPASLVRAAHRRLADLADDPEERAAHLAQAVSRPDAATAALVEAGAAVARGRAAPDVAVQLGEAALRLTPPTDTADLRRRHVDTAYHHVAAGSVPTALEHIEAARRLASEREDVADLEWRRAMFHFLLGDLDAAIDGLRRARATTAQEELRDELTRRLTSMLGWQGRMRDALDEYGDDLRRISENGGPVAGTALGMLVTYCHVLGRPVPADPVELVRHERELHPDAPSHDDPAIRLAFAILTTTDARSAAELFESSRLRAEEQGDDLGIAWIASRTSVAELLAGAWARAEETARASLLAGERLASPPALVYALTAVGVHAALAGDAGRALDAAARMDRYGPFMFAAPQAALIRGYLAWADGDPVTAVALFDDAERHLCALGIPEPTVPLLRWLRADVLIDAGRTDDAAEEAERLLRLGDATGHSLASALGHRARGRLDEDSTRFEAALALHDAHGWPFERALTSYHHGVVLRRMRRVRDARAALTEAADTFTRLGATGWAQRASAEIARLGGRTAQPRALTPSESQVARLAVRGLTNQEIADELVISVRTVASHLSSAYAKLGTRSRTELSTRLAAEDG